MNDERMPDGRTLRSRLAKIDSLVSLPGLVVIGAFLATVLRLTPGEWKCFGIAACIFAAMVATVSESLRRRMHGPLSAYLDASAAGNETSEAALHSAFETAISLPRRMMVMMVGVWLSAAVVVPIAAWAVGDPGWFDPTRFAVLAVAAFCGGAFSAGFVFFGSKRCLDDVRDGLAARIPDPDVRRGLIAPLSLARKLQFAVAGSSVASLIFAMGLAYSRAAGGLEELALSWQGDVLASLAERLETPERAEPDFEAELDGEGAPGEGDLPGEGVGFAFEEPAEPRVPDLEEAVLSIIPDTALLPHPIDFALLDDALEGADLDDRTVAAIREAVEDGEATGRLDQTALVFLRSWRVLSDGRVVVASTPRAALHQSLGNMGFAMAAVLLLAVALSLGVAHMFSSDVRRAADAIRDGAERLALGDLRELVAHESEDELGDLSRSFGRMGQALRNMVARVAEAADRVDATAGDMSSISQSVAAASADQVRRIQQAAELMSEIKSQVNEVAGSAHALNVSVEESSSSILELGAAGDELNDTASVLGEKVDEVSTSIEEMVRSVNQVSNSSEALADIAGETSSSMEEMASAMRAVDTTAEKTAGLSRDVVASAESGQEKVRQTIEGMEAIRDATDTAEGVIRSLGERTKEIGAILDVIDDVADETNLLALNAAIIAAQAGEHGRAFSVVADEIKELADRVLASTKEIGGLIRSVQEESANVTGAIEAGSRSVASGVELSADAGVSLERITASSRESGTRIGEIVTAVREQTKAAAHVVDLMERVRGGVEQIGAAGAEQSRGNEIVHRSSVTMREVAQQVRRTTEEQSRGFGRIRESVEGVRLAVETINGSLQDQSSACSQVAEFLEQVYERTRANEESGQRMDDAMRGLLGQAESLRNDVEKFRI
ncbi:MAG: methyl-accepting chemotaxis protein [Myxococcota bacterium]